VIPQMKFHQKNIFEKKMVQMVIKNFGKNLLKIGSPLQFTQYFYSVVKEESAFR